MMSFEEDTYNAIFTALRHPMRRRILRMLEADPLSYTEILRSLGVENGLLNYHLESLTALITKDEKDHYVLSDYGRAAVNLNTKMEWATPTPPINNPISLNIKAILTVFIMAFLLLGGFVFKLNSDFLLLKTENDSAQLRLQELEDIGVSKLEPLYKTIADESLAVKGANGVQVVNWYCLADRDYIGNGDPLSPGVTAANIYCPDDDAELLFIYSGIDSAGPPLTVRVTKGVEPCPLIAPLAGTDYYFLGNCVSCKRVSSSSSSVNLPKRGWYTVSCYPGVYPDRLFNLHCVPVTSPVAFQIWFSIQKNEKPLLFAANGW